MGLGLGLGLGRTCPLASSLPRSEEYCRSPSGWGASLVRPTHLPTCVGDAARARGACFRRAVPPLRREQHAHATLAQLLLPYPNPVALPLPLLLPQP